MTHAEAFWLVFGMYAVTIALRWTPLLIMERMTVPPLLRRWLRYVPPALFAAILVQALVPAAEQATSLQAILPQWLAVGGALLATLLSRSLLWGAGAAIALYWLALRLLG